MENQAYKNEESIPEGVRTNEKRLSKGSLKLTEKQNGLDNPAFKKGSVESLHEKKEKKTQEEEDPWNIVAEIDTGPKWDEMSGSDKCKRIFINTSKIVTVFILLYFFICSLDLLSSAFKLIAGKSTSTLVSNKYISDPVVGLMVGILLTVLVQSSSTSTSIIVSMVSAQLLTVHDAIPMIMGANVGTSVTNTIVSLTQVGNRNEFRRAFAGATVHDMFNWLAVLVMLPLEVATGMLEKLTGLIVEPLAEKADGADVKILKYITEPFTDLIVMLEGDVLDCWGIGKWQDIDTLIVEYCEEIEHNETTSFNFTTEITTALMSDSSSEGSSFTTDATTASSGGSDSCGYEDRPSTYGIPDSCHFLFYNTNMSDHAVGFILLAMSLVMLCAALIIIVKILHSMLKGSIAVVIKKTLNADIPYVPWVTGYIAILIGAVMTFIVQSSSIFTSTLTPLIGIGVITIERAYPLTLGSNIGTTTTALLASLAGSGDGLIDAVQVALVHLFFNIFGILLFYPIPFMRFPIPMAKFLGMTTAEYRWFAIVYLIGMFFLLPMTIFALSLGGTVVLWSVLGPIIIILIIIAIINFIQNKKKDILPEVLQTWEWVPEPMRSLRPYDSFMTSLPCCKSCNNAAVKSEELEEVAVDAVSSSSRSNSIVEKSNTESPPA